MIGGIWLAYLLIFVVALYLFAGFLRRQNWRDMWVLVLVNAVAVIALFGTGVQSPMVHLFVLTIINVAFGVRLFHTKERLLVLLEDQLANALLIISGALKAGRSLEQGFSLVERGMPSPISDEFKTIRTEQELGVSFEASLKNFMKRTPSKDFKLFLTATLFQRETGGNLIALYDQIVFAVSERRRLQGRLDNMTLQGRYSGYIMMCIPIFFVLYMLLMAPQRYIPMITDPETAWGYFLAFVWLAIGVFWLWNIVNRKLG